MRKSTPVTDWIGLGGNLEIIRLPSMITNLQLLRGLAALAIVFYHTNYIVGDLRHTDFQGVHIFFVISGFIMTYIAQSTVSARDFLFRRLVRVVPLYWLAVVFCVLWVGLGLSNPLYMFPVLLDWALRQPTQIFVWMTTSHGLGNGDNLVNLFKSLAFIPYRDHAGNMQPMLGVGWTLNLEMFYYVLYSVSLFVSRRFAPPLTAIALLVIIGANLALDGGNEFVSFYGGEHTWYFISGITCFYVWKALPVEAIKECRVSLVVMSGFVLVLFLVSNLAAHPQLMEINRFVPVAPLIYSVPVLVVSTILLLHSAGFTSKWRPVLLLGDASYALYLTHTILLETIRTIGEQWAWMNMSQSGMGLTIALVGSILLALFVHRFVELPLMRAMKRWVAPPHLAAATNEGAQHA
ncbi:acyltransferase family protein [Cupriavidus basilensis]|uniref:Acyltransferase n=1 Tax=Cupriavidus basilensis TaxID=68895 RepID=A0A643FME2_9BURK|nr:acyltransferase [Cupriavidus basilensis]QOT77910.1 acyltransferase [Cupriavidus basilensis]